MRLYKLVGENDNYGFAEVSDDLELNIPGMWRPATRNERIYHFLFARRFSYVDWAAVLGVIFVIAVLGLPIWTLVPLTLPAVGLVLLLERTFR